MTPQERVERAVERNRAASAASGGYEISPQDIAADLVDEDVAAGEYEGCSSELDLAASEYIALASRVLGKEN